jgi:transcriptional regulator with XRE-family HTH domain
MTENQKKAKKIIAQLKKIREAKNITQAEIAGRMDVFPPVVNRMENKLDYYPRVDTLIAYVNALGEEIIIKQKTKKSKKSIK